MGIDTWSKEGHARYKREQGKDPVPGIPKPFRHAKGDKPASRKVLFDRLNQARKDLLQELDRYEDAKGREAAEARKPKRRNHPYTSFDSWYIEWHKRSWGWRIKAYDKAFTACLDAGYEVRA